MANNLIKIKRTTVAGRAANTTHIPNAGELAINLTDQIMYSTNGEVVFEIGANVTNQVVKTSVYVGDNVDITTTGIFIGNTTVNLVADSTTIKLANSTVVFDIIKPTESQVSAGDYYLSSDGVWEQLISGEPPGGSNTHVQYNDSDSLGGSAAFTFNNTTNNVLVANTLTIGTATINSTNYSQTANNALYLGGTAAASYALDSDLDAYQTEAGLSANVATLSANNAAYLGGTAAADYQTEAGLSANVATLTANAAGYLGTLSAANYANLSSASFTVQAAVGANVIANTTTIFVGNSTVNLIANSTSLKLANSTVNTQITVPSSTAYTGSYFLHANGSWVEVISTVSTRVYQAYTSTGDQTIFAVSGGYDVGFIEVFYNGVHLAEDEYTANGTHIQLDVGALNGTIIEVVGYKVLNITEVVAIPTGANTHVQYNDSDLLGGSAGFTFDVTTNNVTVGNTITIGTTTIVNSSMVSVTAGSLLSANIQISACTTTSYTLLATDSGKIVTMDNGSPMTVTIPAGLPIGFRCQVLRLGAGTCTLSNTGQTGASIFSRTAAFAITARYGSASVFEAAANTYICDGLL